uniref:Uncharacterized protein n=1 Tax=Ditylenchus dipsaci TaxID=166011 RepID=A0A915DSI3_9BILA
MSSNNEYHPGMGHQNKMVGQEGMRQTNMFARPGLQQGQQQQINNSTMFNGGGATGQAFDNGMSGGNANATSANSTVIKSYLDSMQQASTNEFRMPKNMHDFQNTHMPALHTIHNNHTNNSGETLHAFQQLNPSQMAAAGEC